ncbi:hypothetical protein HPT29_027640 (plasmid) [Microvirga terrae]|uniref:Uncharacterized protein n=1 Tax=Microvirga terrae TaxID=2740529 RepID=A0ABY5S3L0_9HYPH|nr:hypothetical protein [Microvirga terrae]UVF22794.1 hypothetical protein HPT29_027640 [Microvirga terrae]
MKILSFIASIFGFFGHVWNAFIQTIRPILEAFGFVHPQPEDITGDVAEGALAEARSQRSSLDRRPVEVWTTIQRFDAVRRWAIWKTGGKAGPEPSLAGFTLRERLKIKQARPAELDTLAIRHPQEIEMWLTGPSVRLKALTEAELTERRPKVAAVYMAAEQWRANTGMDMTRREAASNRSSARAKALLAETNELMARTNALVGTGGESIYTLKSRAAA